MQASARAVGIACQTLAEVETMVAAGFGDILLTNSILDIPKLSRLVGLTSRATLAITADSEQAVEAVAAVARTSGRIARIYVECDIRGARSGFADPVVAAALATRVATTPHLELGGLAGRRVMAPNHLLPVESQGHTRPPATRLSNWY